MSRGAVKWHEVWRELPRNGRGAHVLGNAQLTRRRGGRCACEASLAKWAETGPGPALVDRGSRESTNSPVAGRGSLAILRASRRWCEGCDGTCDGCDGLCITRFFCCESSICDGCDGSSPARARIRVRVRAWARARRQAGAHAHACARVIRHILHTLKNIKGINGLRLLRQRDGCDGFGAGGER
jgi:hypothetical protein